jgi:hypothetical protein
MRHLLIDTTVTSEDEQAEASNDYSLLCGMLKSVLATERNLNSLKHRCSSEESASSLIKRWCMLDLVAHNSATRVITAHCVLQIDRPFSSVYA